MPHLVDDPIVKVTLNLYRRDHEELQRRFGYGWSAHVRAAVHEYLHKTKTIEDLIRERGET